MGYTKYLNLSLLFLCFFIMTGVTAQAPSNKPDNVTAPPQVTVSLPADMQPGKVNYVRTREAISPITDINVYNSAPYTQVRENTAYFDGLGRKLQVVDRQITPSAKDKVSFFVYDHMGRETKRYLPYVQTNGSQINDGRYKTTPYFSQKTFYENTTLNPNLVGEQVYYGITDFEPSPLNRSRKTFEAGNNWAGSAGTPAEKYNGTEYYNNSTADAVVIWNVSNDPFSYDEIADANKNIPSNAGLYAAGLLEKTVTKDEEGNVLVEYKDENGLVLRKRQVGTIPADYSGYNGFLCTYYVYDDFGLLRFIITPQAVDAIRANWSLPSDVVDGLCFRYEYDNRDRLIASKQPGKGWLYNVYDVRDRLVFSQDANMRNNGQWETTLYDGINRTVIKGITAYNTNATALQSTVNNQTVKPFIPPPPAGINIDLVLTGFKSGYYEASSSITLDVGFESVSGVEFTAFVYPDPNAPNYEIQTVNGAAVNKNPIPGGATFYPLNVTNYDNYNQASKSYTANYNGQLTDVGNNPNAMPLPASQYPDATGLVTSIKTRVIADPGNLNAGAWLETVNFYDDRGRVIQVQSDNYKQGRDVVVNRYDFRGNVVGSYQEHSNPSGTPLDVHLKTVMEYDHADKLKNVWKTLNNNSATKLLLVKYDYNELGELLNKELGQQKDATGAYTAVPIGTFNYNYNIRGWLTGINKDYVNNAGIPDSWFGMELNYDKGFQTGQLNGNIAGTKWRSKGDGERRAFGYTYDKANRLLSGDFSQFDGNNYTDNGVVNFDMVMGNGTNPALAYDANGNIKAMKQWGLKLNNSPLIDDLHYDYYTNSNKLKAVEDLAVNASGIVGGSWGLADFIDNNKITDDYGYDKNGNLVSDLNKRIIGSPGQNITSGGAITYNLLNMPLKINVTADDGVTNRGNISYVYDAAGNKLQKTVLEKNATVINNNVSVTTDITTTTYYLGAFTYETKVYSDPGLSGKQYFDRLQLVSHDEGRIRYIAATSTDPAHFEYDYFVKDNLGNIRMVLSEELQKGKYPVVTFEDANVGNEQTFYDKVDVQREQRPTDFKTSTTNGDRVQMLSKNTQSIGAGSLLKVMADDKLHVMVDYFTPDNLATDNQNADGIGSVVTQLLTLLGSSAAPVPLHGSGSVITTGLQNSFPFTSFLQPQVGNSTPGVDIPKSYLNILFFDEQFKFVPNNSEIIPITTKGSGETIYRILGDAKVAPKNGYAYIYVSNESNTPVYFDNLQITHENGGLLEETHYYPYGLTMSGISSKFNNPDYTENKQKYNGIELENGLDLNAYDAQLRELDPQIGRWWQVDPKVEDMEMWSPYASNYDNPIRYSDPKGDMGTACCGGFIGNALASAAGTLNGFLNGVSGGLWPTAPLGTSMYTDEQLQYYESGVKYGQMGSIPTMRMLPPVFPRLVPAGGPNMPLTPNPPSLPRLDRVNSNTTPNSSSSTSSSSSSTGTTGNGRGSNDLKPDKENATGDHVAFKRDVNGHIYKYEEYKANPKNPSGYDSKKRFDGGKPDGSAGASHRNKETGVKIPTPHISGKDVPGGARTPEFWEVPTNARFQPPATTGTTTTPTTGSH